MFFNMNAHEFSFPHASIYDQFIQVSHARPEGAACL
jgi:hypothetical protein